MSIERLAEISIEEFYPTDLGFLVEESELAEALSMQEWED